MNNIPMQKLTLIISESQSKKYHHHLKELNLIDGITLIGRGTVSIKWLHVVGLTSQKREIIQFLVPAAKGEELLKESSDLLQLEKPGQGIAFISPIEPYEPIQKDTYMFKKMTVIVDRGLAEDVIDVAKECGVTGGTIVHGRGTGTREEEKLFGFEIEPEKELVIMLIPSTLVSLVTETLTKTFHFNTPNKGILYLEPVLETRGLFEAPEQ